MSILYKLESSWKRELQLRKCPNFIGLWASLWCMFLIDDTWGGPKSLWAVLPLDWWSWALYESRVSKPLGASQ